jgi:hypothetical protein
VTRADNLGTFWNPKGLSRPVQVQLYLEPFTDEEDEILVHFYLFCRYSR